MKEENIALDESNELIESILLDYKEYENNQTTVTGWGCRGACCVESR